MIPVQVSGASPKLLSRSVTFTAELQRGEPWENIPLEFSRLSIDSVKVSVAFVGDDASYHVLPSLVGLRMLMNPSKTHHRIWEDVDFLHV